MYALTYDGRMSFTDHFLIDGLSIPLALYFSRLENHFNIQVFSQGRCR